MADLREAGFKTKMRLLANKRMIGGIAFSLGPLAAMLRNPFTSAISDTTGARSRAGRRRRPAAARRGRRLLEKTPRRLASKNGRARTGVPILPCFVAGFPGGRSESRRNTARFT